MTDINVRFQDYSYVRVEADYGIISEMRDYFSFEVEGAKFNPKVRAGIWDGMIRLMGADGTLPWGLLNAAKTFARNLDYTIEIDERLSYDPQITREDFDSWLDSKEIYSGDNRITPHWYQSDTVFHAINNRRGVLNLPTSSGKSAICCMMSRWYLENHTGKVLILVPSISLVNQMRDDFVDYRLFPSSAINLLGGGEKNSRNNNDDALITVSTWQSAVKKDKEWLGQFGMLLTDECFHGDTMIKTPKGDVEISKLRPGDKVMSYDEITKEIIVDEVVEIHKNLTKSSNEKMYELEMDDGTIVKVTGNHKFLTEDGEWIRADELTNDDEIVSWKK